MYVIGSIILLLGILKVVALAALCYYDDSVVKSYKDASFIILVDGIYEIFAGCYLIQC